MAVSPPDLSEPVVAPGADAPDRAATAIRREFVRQARRAEAGLIVTETAGRWNVSGPVDVEALAAAALRTVSR